MGAVAAFHIGILAGIVAAGAFAGRNRAIPIRGIGSDISVGMARHFIHCQLVGSFAAGRSGAVGAARRQKEPVLDLCPGAAEEGCR